MEDKEGKMGKSRHPNLTKLRVAKEKLKVILKREQWAAVGISLAHIEVRITTDDQEIIERIKKLTPRKVDGVSVNIIVVGPIKAYSDSDKDPDQSPVLQKKKKQN